MNLAIAQALVMLLAVVPAILLRTPMPTPACIRAAGGSAGRRVSALHVILAVEATPARRVHGAGVALVPERDASTLLTQAIAGAAGVCPIEV